MGYLSDFFQLFFPYVCVGCGRKLFRHEEQLCRLCISKLPYSYYHKIKDNPVEKIFWGRVNIEKATSFLIYKKDGVVKNILHDFKYRNNKELAVAMGKLFATELNKYSYFQDVDYIIPVPLHPRKLKKRGYNQSEYIAKGMYNILNVQILTDCIIKVENTMSQTKLSRYNRWLNVGKGFAVKTPEILKNKSILLVDDVVTTGATLEAMASTIENIEGIKIYIATIAAAGN